MLLPSAAVLRVLALAGIPPFLLPWTESRMRKRLVTGKSTRPAGTCQWLDLNMVTAEITSEDRRHPIECALLEQDEDGWRAGEPGVQQLRVLFDQPQDICRITLEFVERSGARTQEFVLRWSGDGRATEEIVRQQWNFSPDGAISESEDYQVRLIGARMLELTVDPDISGAHAYASLRRLRLAER
jgi:hypothetical protein